MSVEPPSSSFRTLSRLFHHSITTSLSPSQAQEMKILSSGALAVALSLSFALQVEGALDDDREAGTNNKWLSWCGKHYEVIC